MSVSQAARFIGVQLNCVAHILRINNFSTSVRLEISNDVTQAGVRSFEKEFRSWKTDSDVDPAYKDWLATPFSILVWK